MANKTGKGTFKKGDDVRRNRNGQRNGAAVALAVAVRDLYVEILGEPISVEITDPAISNLEFIVRLHVESAKGGDADAREKMFDRVIGKPTQHHEIEADISGELDINDKARNEAAKQLLEWRQHMSEQLTTMPTPPALTMPMNETPTN